MDRHELTLRTAEGGALADHAELRIVAAGAGKGWREAGGGVCPAPQILALPLRLVAKNSSPTSNWLPGLRPVLSPLEPQLRIYKMGGETEWGYTAPPREYGLAWGGSPAPSRGAPISCSRQPHPQQCGASVAWTAQSPTSTSFFWAKDQSCIHPQLTSPARLTIPLEPQMEKPRPKEGQGVSASQRQVGLL